MKTIAFPTSCLAALAAAALASASAEDPRVGSMPADEFTQANAKAAELIKAFKPDKAPLAEKDLAFFQQINSASTLQAALSAMAPSKATSAAVKEMAKAEVEEQSEFATKLKEIADAKGLAMTSNPDPASQQLIISLGEKSGADFDKGYILTCAVKGHQMLQATMEKVRAETKDDTLRELAVTALPAIKLHLRLAIEMAAPYEETVLTPAAPPFPENQPVPVGKKEGRYGN